MQNQNSYIIYSVMQSDQNSFYSVVVLGSVNMALRDEANILKQIFGKQISL